MAGTTWNDFCKSVDRFAKKANRKIGELTDTAAIKLKISAKKGELDEEYGKLGRLTYDHTYAGANTAEDGLDVDRAIAACVDRIGALREEIAALEAQAGPRAEAEFEGEAQDTSDGGEDEK